jgi:putative ABC transport system permease protein
MALTTMLAVTASIMAGALIVASQQPFDHAFSRQHGAHLTARFDGGEATESQVAATAHAAGVTAAAGPFAVVSATPQIASGAGGGGLVAVGNLPPLTIAGRARPGGPVDAVSLDKGHWPTAAGQIVIGANDDVPADMWRVGSTIEFPALPGTPQLTIVGIARSVSRTADAWVAPAEIAALTRPGATPSYEMLYRFAHAGSSAEVARAKKTVAAAAPRGALLASQSYLTTKHAADQETATFVPFIVAFGVLGLVMSVLIIAIVVGGAVSSGTRRIGVLKSLGLTPGQVGRAYVAQALIPACAGTALGVLVGNLAAAPLLHQASHTYGTGSLAVAWWLDLAVPAGVLVLVVASALAPALRAARLRTVEALAVGRTPRVGRGRFAARVASRLPLPRAVTMGLAGPFARPARSATIWAAVAFGAIGVTFAFGLGASLSAIQDGLNRDDPGDVVVSTFAAPEAQPAEGGGGGGPRAGGAAPEAPGVPGVPGVPEKIPGRVDTSALLRTVSAQRGTAGYVGLSEQEVDIAGVPGAVQALAYEGDASWAGLQLVQGHWFTGAGQVVVGRRLLEATGKDVGDTVSLEKDGRTVEATIVGEALGAGDDAMRIATDERTLEAVGIAVQPEMFHVKLSQGTDTGTYLRSLNAALRPLHVEAIAEDGEMSSTVLAMETLITMLTLMLVVVAGLGVLNTVVLDTRERVHDLGVMKALGMSPRQTVAMVITSVAGIGALAGVVGVPLGIALHGVIVPAMGSAAGTHVPHADLAVYHAPQIVLLGFAGLVIATAGALLPATWTARTSTSASLRTE